MKEATGELNATVVILTIIAVLVVFFYYTIWPVIRNNLNQTTTCSKAICPKENRQEENGTVNCYTIDDSGNKSDLFSCVWKG